MLVSVEEFRRYLGGFEMTSMLQEEVVSLLTGTQQQLETYLNRPVELVQVREVALSDGMGNLYLSVSPVRKIISYGVTVGSDFSSGVVEVQPINTSMVPDTSLDIDARMIDKSSYKAAGSSFRPYGMVVPYVSSRYTVEYIAGLDGSDQEQIKSAIKRVAAREFTKKHDDTGGLRTGHIEDTEVGDTRNIGWTLGELQSLMRYRRRIVI